jgi:hypothetical protein
LSAYPNLRLVPAYVDSAGVITQEAEQTDVILNLPSPGHRGNIQHIKTGMANKGRPKPGHMIYMSGASLLLDPGIQMDRFGETCERIWDDLDGKEEVLTRLRENLQREGDDYILTIRPEEIKTALIVTPIIYGMGNGPVHRQSVQIPELARLTLQRGRGFQIGKGLNRWSNIHINDLSSLVLKMGEEAIDGDESKSLWNLDGVYFAESEETVRPIATWVVAKLAFLKFEDY